MGFVFSRPAAAAALPTPLPTLTIRNLTITTLELRLVERLDAHPHLHKPKRLVKVTSRISSRRRSHESHEPPAPSTTRDQERPSSANQSLWDVVIEPFSECQTPVYVPDPTGHEQIRLVFEDRATRHRYSAEIPGSSRRSIVLRSHPGDHQEVTKEFTAIYLPQHAYLALFSSANLSSWMSTLDSGSPLSSLSIPGTHNSPTHHVALPSVRCQAVSVLEQLNNGVRFLDVRVSCPPFTTLENFSSSSSSSSVAPKLALVHSAFPVSLTGSRYLSELLTTLYTFLEEHPSETILLSLKREGTGRGTDQDLSQILHHHYITSEPSKWYTDPEIPTLRQCRGRIILVRRFHLHPNIPPSKGGIDGSVWPDNVADGMCGSGTIRIQDYYGVNNTAEIQRKVRFAQEGLERAGAEVPARGTTPMQRPLFINFLSASNFFNASCWPDRIAVKMNPSMTEHLCMAHGKVNTRDSTTGIVVLDWVGHHGDWDIVRCIVGWNARLQLRQ